MTLDDNKRLVREFLESALAGDFARMDALLDDDATWWVMPSPLSPGLLTKEQFMGFYPEFFASFAGPFTMQFDQVTAEDDRVCITAKGNVKLGNGNTYESDYHWLFTVRDGKVLAVREYGNTAHAVAVFGG